MVERFCKLRQRQAGLYSNVTQTSTCLCALSGLVEQLQTVMCAVCQMSCRAQLAGCCLCREVDSGSSTPSSMAPSAAASPRRWSSSGNRARFSEEGSAMLRRASEASGLAEAGPHAHLPPNPSGTTSPDHGTTSAPSSLGLPTLGMCPCSIAAPVAILVHGMC